MDAFDVVILGAGPVGASLAIALRDASVRVAIVDPQPVTSLVAPLGAAFSEGPASVTPDWDSRIWAVSPASIAFLDRIGVWPLVDSSRAEPCVRMRVHGDRTLGGRTLGERSSTLEFDAYDAGVETLATMLEARSLARALAIQLSAAPHVTSITATPSAVARTERDVTLTLDTGQTLTAALAVAADGGDSWLRAAAGIDTESYDYGAQGVVANFRCERPHYGTAYQWLRCEFHPDQVPGVDRDAASVLAYLPLPEGLMSMVWSTPNAHAAQLLALPHAALAEQVAAAGDSVLGALTVVTPPRAFPLTRRSAATLACDRVALVGDAAHVIHPLAGQGVNLGFGDAQALAAILTDREVFRDAGDARVLARYRRSRAEAILLMRSVTHGLEWLFARPGSIPAWLRGSGLELTNRFAVGKNVLARHALG